MAEKEEKMLQQSTQQQNQQRAQQSLIMCVTLVILVVFLVGLVGKDGANAVLEPLFNTEVIREKYYDKPQDLQPPHDDEIVYIKGLLRRDQDIPQLPVELALDPAALIELLQQKQQQEAAAAASNTIPPHKLHVPRRYQPSWFDPSTSHKFGPRETPLVVLKHRINSNMRGLGDTSGIPQPPVPPDWDGGYGWKFIRYHPSPFELRWRRESRSVERIMSGTPLCNLRRVRFAKENRVYLQNVHRMPADDLSNRRCSGTLPTEPQQFDPEVFSRMEYRYVCLRPPCRSVPSNKQQHNSNKNNNKDKSSNSPPQPGDVKFSYIEPLVGLLRHPNACTEKWDWILSKNYMVHDPWPLFNVNRATNSPKPRVMYFDAGASTWDAGAGGASQSWFHRVYETSCFNFTDWFMFELEDHKPQEVFSKLPGYVKPGYRWFNIPLSIDAASWDNPLNHLLLEAKQEDIVIFKIDFDSPTIEAALINQILETPQVWHLLQGRPLYFEHHVNQEILRSPWGLSTSYDIYHHDSLRLFTKLREKGILAHSWV